MKINHNTETEARRLQTILKQLYGLRVLTLTTYTPGLNEIFGKILNDTYRLKHIEELEIYSLGEPDDRDSLLLEEIAKMSKFPRIFGIHG